jgi:hypothetical protein
MTQVSFLLRAGLETGSPRLTPKRHVTTGPPDVATLLFRYPPR